MFMQGPTNQTFLRWRVSPQGSIQFRFAFYFHKWFECTFKLKYIHMTSIVQAVQEPHTIFQPLQTALLSWTLVLHPQKTKFLVFSKPCWLFLDDFSIFTGNGKSTDKVLCPSTWVYGWMTNFDLMYSNALFLKDFSM